MNDQHTWSIYIDIQRGSKFDDDLHNDQNFFNLVDIRTGMCLMDNIVGMASAIGYQKKIGEIYKAWDSAFESMKYISGQNDMNPILIASAILRTGHLTLEASVVNYIKGGLEKYAEICRNTSHHDLRNEAALKYIENGKNLQIPFI